MRARRFSTVARSLGASVLMLFVLALAACGSSETKSGEGGVSVGREPAGVDSPAGSGPDLAQSSEGAVVTTEEPAALGDFGRKVVKTADLGLRSEEVRRSTARAQQVAATAGGTVLSSQVYRSEDSVTADLVLSVPSDEFERVLGELRSLGEKVTTDSISGQDVTEEYVDLKSRERNLKATEESMLRLYDRAKNVEEVLSIQRELTCPRGHRACAGQDKVPGSAQHLLPDHPEHPTPHEPAATQAYLGSWRRRGAGIECFTRCPPGHGDGHHLGCRLRLVACTCARRGTSVVEAAEPGFETRCHGALVGPSIPPRDFRGPGFENLRDSRIMS